MDHYMAGSTILELDCRKVVEVRGTGRADRKGTYTAVALEAKLGYTRASKHARIVRSVWEMANGTALLFDGCMLEYERALFINVTLHANCVDSCRKTGLL
jgi:hypothetical protein